MRILCFFQVLCVLVSCSSSAFENNAQGEWIVGSEKDQLAIIESQFRGFDNAMVETGYRYQEMFWGGLDGNWEYANYQLNKMELAIKQGIERRPKRGESASFFLNETLPSLRAVIEKRDSSMFAKQMEFLTIACNSCHATEKVSFFHVQIPNERRSPIR